MKKTLFTAMAAIAVFGFSSTASALTPVEAITAQIGAPDGYSVFQHNVYAKTVIPDAQAYDNSDVYNNVGGYVDFDMDSDGEAASWNEVYDSYSESYLTGYGSDAGVYSEADLGFGEEGCSQGGEIEVSMNGSGLAGYNESGVWATSTSTAGFVGSNNVTGDIYQGSWSGAGNGGVEVWTNGGWYY